MKETYWFADARWHCYSTGIIRAQESVDKASYQLSTSLQSLSHETIVKKVKNKTVCYLFSAHTHKVWAFRGMSKQQQTITKQLQNLYSWTQFYQERGNKDQIRKCQTQIAELKKAYNQLKSNKNGKTKNA